MITIHNSSLTFPRTGDVKLAQAAVDKNQAQSASEDGRNKTTQASPASTPDQIQAAIAQTGLSKESSFSNDNNRQTNIALNAYNQTRNQAIQAELESTITRVDYYA